MSSPFLTIPESEWVGSNGLAFAIRDRFQVSPGHTLIVPHRLVATWFDATPDEHAALLALLAEVRARLDQGTPRPDGYNIGINAGEAAGQTVMHLHVHLIPRFRGDVEDPRGGVRHVIPGKGNYLADRPRALVTGGVEDPFLRHQLPLWATADAINIIAAFVQESGLDLLRDQVFAALGRGARIRVITGDYLAITQAAALERLLDWSGLHEGRFEARVVETAQLPASGQSFHPKSWRFEGPGFGTAFVGSSNVSRSALRSGVEWNLRLERSRDPETWKHLATAFDAWWERARRLDADWVRAYAQRAVLQHAPPPLGEEDEEPLEKAPAPHPVQREALDALAENRDEGRRRACVVLATGLGKTLLAALDVAGYADAQGRLPRVLFLAHREELLDQAAKTFRRALRERWPGLRVGFFVGERGEDLSRRVTAGVTLPGSGASISVPGSSASRAEVPRAGGPLPGAGEPTLVIELGRFTVERTPPAVGIQVVEPAGGRELGEIGDGAAREGGEISVEGSSGGGEGTDESEVARWRRSPRESRAPPEGEEGQARAELEELGAEGVRPRRE